MNKNFFILFLIIFLLPLVDASERIIKTDVEITFNSTAKNLTIKVEDAVGTGRYSWILNNSDFNEIIHSEFIRDVGESETCNLFNSIQNLTIMCSDKVEKYDRIVGKNDVRTEVVDSFNRLDANLENYTTNVANHLSTCESEKTTCEIAKGGMYSQEQVDKATAGRIGLVWLLIAFVAPIVYFKRDAVFGGGPKVIKNNPSLDRLSQSAMRRRY